MKISPTKTKNKKTYHKRNIEYVTLLQCKNIMLAFIYHNVSNNEYVMRCITQKFNEIIKIASENKRWW